jgi:hypothetical protein
MLDHIDYLVYSSHKTATQTVVHTLNEGGFNAGYIHTIDQLWISFDHCRDKSHEEVKNIFLEALKQYKENNKRKMKLITIIRNPQDRLLSSFFQTYDTDEMHFKKKSPENTTVETHNVYELLEMYETHIVQQNLKLRTEALDEISSIFDTPIVEKLKKRIGHHYFENEWVELYVFDFPSIVGNQFLEYLNHALQIQLEKKVDSNTTESKRYKEKYKLAKQLLTKEVKHIILTQYHPYYFK